MILRCLCSSKDFLPDCDPDSGLPRFCSGLGGNLPVMQRHHWSRLSNQQVGAYTEYFVKMELTMYGFHVYSTEVDDRGVDFVARYNTGPFIEIQVKSIRNFNYVFMHKTKFVLSDSLYVALGLLFDDKPPELYLIPSRV